ncbi:MAG: tRNA lysidine(34) synthetase TilS [Muribaculaceae bacterium]|nr:tRNA lysidine(34) synthetase TilS [Muribaculaceae bacterium]
MSEFKYSSTPAARYLLRAVKQCVNTLPNQPRLLVTISGGADSVALLRSLHAIGSDIVAAHCNFHLRDAESNRDEEFTRRLCESLGVPLEVTHFNVASSRLTGESDEMTCRRLRYDWFDTLMLHHGCARIVTGHNADDNAETLLLNLLRGSGLKGLRGMLPDTGRILRPLLTCSRADIIAYLNDLAQDYVTDSTNLTVDYRRNFIRHEVLPLFESRWPGTRSALQRTLSALRGQELIVEAAISQALITATENLLPLDTITEFADPVTLLLKYITPLQGTPELAQSMAKAATAPNGQRWQLPDGLTAIMLKDGLHIDRPCNNNESQPLTCTRVEMNDETRKLMRRPGPPVEVWLPQPLDTYIVRYPQPGDRIAPLGMKGTQLLSDIMKDAHLADSQRRQLRVIVDSENNDIIWLEGLKRSRHQLVKGNVAYRVTTTTCITSPDDKSNNNLT